MLNWNSTEQPQAVVLVLNWNGTEVISDCLDSLRSQSYHNFKVLVVDNNSFDTSPKIIASQYSDVKLLELEQNVGFAQGNNEGIELLFEELPELPYVVMLNNDTKAQPNWLESLVLAADADQTIGAVASKLVCWDGTTEPKFIDTAGDLFYKHGLAGKRGHGESVLNFDQSDYVFGVCAGAGLYRMSALRDTGLLDCDFFAYNEDVDLAFRLRLAGWNCYYAAPAIVWHRVSYSSVSYSDNALFWAKRNSIWVVIKNLPTSLILKNIFSIVGYNILSDVPWVLRGRIKPIFKARMAAVFSSFKMYKKRRIIQKNRKISPKELEKWIIKYTPWRESIIRNIKNVNHIEGNKS